MDTQDKKNEMKQEPVAKNEEVKKADDATKDVSYKAVQKDLK